MGSVARYQYPSDNEVPNATLALGTGSTAVGYALSALGDGSLSDGWGSTVATLNTILMDFGGATKALKWISFHNHNFDAGLTITIEANSSNSWTSPPFSATVTVPTVRADGRGQDFVWLNAGQATGYRWWRVSLPSTNSVAWRLGELWASVTVTRTLPSDNYQPGLSVGDVRDGVSVETPTGRVLTVPAPTVRSRISGAVKGPRSTVEAVRDWRRKCQGFAQATAFILEDDATTKEVFFVTHEDDSGEIVHVNGQIWQSTVSLITQSPGLVWS
jgi:hypothetical protein